MQIHQIKPKHKLKKRKRIGRGGKKGTYSGKGMKGQKSRAGKRLAPVVRELIKKYPKLRGYRTQKRGKDIAVINIGDLDKNFKDSEIVSPESLIKKGLIRKIKGKVPKVKILGQGKLTKKITIEKCQLSKTAKEKYAK
jgi:large subunit ribosomal protein L15